MNYFDVIIATPGKVFNEYYIDSIIKTTQMLNKNNISFYWANSYNPHLGVARQNIINEIIDKNINYNKIFWIDSDINWNPEDFLKLYFSEKKIISGIYILNPIKITNDYKNFPISIMKDWIPSLNSNFFYRNTIKDLDNFENLFEVNETGFGFICIKKDVFDNFKDPHFASVNVENLYIFSEDTAWCYKAKKIGYKIYVDKNVLVGHTKNIFLDWKK